MKEQKKKGSVLREIISIISLILKLILYYVKKKPFLSISIMVIVVGTPTIVIPRVTSEKLPTPSPEIIVPPPEVTVKTDNEPTSEEPEEIQKDTGSGIQRTENKLLSEKLNQMRKDVKSGRQQMEDMRKTVKKVDEEVQKASEKVEKMTKRLNSLSEN